MGGKNLRDSGSLLFDTSDNGSEETLTRIMPQRSISTSTATSMSKPDSPWTGALNSTGKDDWETPDDLFERYNKRYHFILDAAADNGNHKCDRYFGPGGVVEDSLVVAWPLNEGNIWLNPPYSRGLQAKFVSKAFLEAEFSANHVVCLLPARADTKLFHEIIQPYGEVTFLQGRVKFVGAAYPAPFPSMIVVF